ncbi:Hpt domain-containing protein [Sphingosinicella sp. BN140058]|uniref:Hpt domain-containing protein n=1 Tax=Sphingosinicella sp. BN140058 TaxID=1892855 RepID=UPI001FB0EB4C|nr:Hpt domain-containing protein [Sphingosinicella sp. BN140058]
MDTIDSRDEELVDWKVHARTRTQLGPAFVRILGYLREDGDKSVERIEDAMHRKDATGLVLPAHTVKTEARQFGAEPLGALAEEIEFAARRAIEGHYFPDDLVPQVARLRPLYARTIELLERDANPLCQRTPARAAGA